MNSDQYLYYQVGDYKTTNKLRAVEAAVGNMSRVHFYFADDAHSLHDWTEEPVQSINELIDQRVQELRDRHSYVSLWYSGGYDSQTILDSFIRTSTRLDELLIYSRPYIQGEHNFEHTVALKQAQWVKTHLQPWIKIRFVEYNQDTTFNFYKDHGSDWIYHGPGHFQSFTKTSRYNTALYHTDLQGLDQISGRCDITGVEKPRVNLRDGKWYAQMPDVTLFHHMSSPRELFYISPEATTLYIKQVWMVIAWFESNLLCDHNFVHEVQGKKSNLSTAIKGQLYADWNKSFGRSDVFDWVAATGYNKFYSDNNVTGTTSSLTNLDSAVLKDLAEKTESSVYNSWSNGLDYISKNYADIWNPVGGFDVCMSNAIYVKDFEPKVLVVD